jgi:hypothetical protein
MNKRAFGHSQPSRIRVVWARWRFTLFAAAVILFFTSVQSTIRSSLQFGSNPGDFFRSAIDIPKYVISDDTDMYQQTTLPKLFTAPPLTEFPAKPNDFPREIVVQATAPPSHAPLPALVHYIEAGCEAGTAQSGSAQTCESLTALSPQFPTPRMSNFDWDKTRESDQVPNSARKSKSGTSRNNLPWTEHVLGEHARARRIDDGLDGSEHPFCVRHTMRNESQYNSTRCDMSNSSFDFVKKKCEGIGARLCTLDEVTYASLTQAETFETCATKVKSRTGKWPRVWTSTRCGEGAFLFVFVRFCFEIGVILCKQLPC